MQNDGSPSLQLRPSICSLNHWEPKKSASFILFTPVLISHWLNSRKIFSSFGNGWQADLFKKKKTTPISFPTGYKQCFFLLPFQEISPPPLLSFFHFIIYLLLPKVVSNNVASPTSNLINAIKHFLTKAFGRIWNVSLMKLGAQQLLSLLSPEIVSQQKRLTSSLSNINKDLYVNLQSDLKGPLTKN